MVGLNLQSPTAFVSINLNIEIIGWRKDNKKKDQPLKKKEMQRLQTNKTKKKLKNLPVMNAQRPFYAPRSKCESL